MVVEADVIRQLAVETARTNALLEALTREVRVGFDKMDGRINTNDQRLLVLERYRNMFVGLFSLGGLALVFLDRIRTFFHG